MTKKEWLVAVICTFITVCGWVVFDIIHTKAKVEIPAQIQQLIEPFNPELNTAVLESIP